MTKKQPPIGEPILFMQPAQKLPLPAFISARQALASWQWLKEDDHRMVAADQPDPRWPKMRRLLERNGWTPDQPLTYAQVCALAGWRQECALSWRQPEEHKGGGAAGQTVESTGQTAKSAAPVAPGKKNGQKGQRPARLWTPWPQPSKAAVERARQLLQLVQQELIEDARESVAVRFDHARLAVRGEMAQLDPARHWEREGLPRLMVALDFSGSMGGFVNEVAAIGAALAAAFPWLVIAAAPNGNLAALTNVAGKHYIADGEWCDFDGMKATSTADAWTQLAARHPVRACIYVGDYEDVWIAPAFPGRFGVLSVFQARAGAPIRTDAHFGQPAAWPVVTRCNSVSDFIDGLRMLLPAVLIGG